MTIVAASAKPSPISDDEVTELILYYGEAGKTRQLRAFTIALKTYVALKELRHLRSVLAPRPEDDQPKGEFATVPRHPTKAMTGQGAFVLYDAFGKVGESVRFDLADAIYEAMIDASPKPSRAVETNPGIETEWMNKGRDLIDAWCERYVHAWPPATARDKLVTDIIALASQPLLDAPRVKALSWVDAKTPETSPRWKAESACGEYLIVKNMRDVEFWSPQLGGHSKYWNTLDEAKVAAQADYEQRIRSALQSDGEGR